MKFTVFTPTYNRAYILKNLYNSLQRQVYYGFEWLIIDDGSTDLTEQLVQRWKNESNFFPIRYYKQENSGKCCAINRALDLAQGELFFVVDSDDYLTDDALKKLAEWEDSLPDKSMYCGVSGNLGLSEEETLNYQFPDGFLDGDFFDRYRCADGERAFAFYTHIHRQYKYPVFSDEKFMTEAVAYNRMAHDGYKMRYYNDIICIYEYQEDGLTKSGDQIFLSNPKGYGLWLRERDEFMGTSAMKKLRLWYSFYCEMTYCLPQYRLTKKKCAEYIGAPLWSMYVSKILHNIWRVMKKNENKRIQS